VLAWWRELRDDAGCAPVLLICRSGKRSLEAGKVLLREGFKEVFNIQGGFEGDLMSSTTAVMSMDGAFMDCRGSSASPRPAACCAAQTCLEENQKNDTLSPREKGRRARITRH